MMLLTSSILAYYSTNAPTYTFQGCVTLPLQARVARWFSIFLRRLGKLLAELNAVVIVATGLFQFSGLYDRCFCDSSILGITKHAYGIIPLVSLDVGGMRTAQIGGLFLAAGPAMIFSGFVALFIDPPLPS
jgi:predicted metal-binding membrane protein